MWQRLDCGEYQSYLHSLWYWSPCALIRDDKNTDATAREFSDSAPDGTTNEGGEHEEEDSDRSSTESDDDDDDERMEDIEVPHNVLI